jgi:lipase
MPPTTTDAGGQALADPFDARFELAVAGGALHVARSGPPANMAEAVVLAAHGITGSHMTWRTVARELAGRCDACLLAPDLRGRGRSASLPGPFGFAAHMEDLIAVLDQVGAERVVLVGHSMGAYLVARMAADHPERVASVVLADAGLPFPAPPEDPDDVLDAVVGPAVTRLATIFASAEEYVAGWRKNPAFAKAWDGDVEAYVRYDVVSDGHLTRSVVSEEAVRADSRELLLDDATRLALDRVRAPIRLLRAPRGLQDDAFPMIPQEFLEALRVERPEVVVDEVPRVNHYTLVLGDTPGPARVAAAIEAAIRDDAIA